MDIQVYVISILGPKHHTIKALGMCRYKAMHFFNYGAGCREVPIMCLRSPCPTEERPSVTY